MKDIDNVLYRIENNSFTYKIEKEGAILPLKFSIIQTVHWECSHSHSFNHEGIEVSFNRIFIFRRGGCKLQWDGKLYHFKPGKIYLLPVNHPFSVVYAEDFDLFAFHFNFTTQSGHEVFENRCGIQSIDAPWLLKNITTYTDSNKTSETMLWQSSLFQTACRFCAPLVDSVFGEEKEYLDFKELFEYIKENISPALSIGLLAEKMNMPRAQLSKSFQNTMGFSLKSYLIRTLMSKAKDLIHRGALTIQQTASLLGYEDQYYFHRAFKREVGVTPMEYRKIMRYR